ncbi:MAG: hypothetical protein KUG81_02755 [Gammaproteobacteria bacterium]|nr:hypothetical protein [Gammaproteobacteria bacterium]
MPDPAKTIEGIGQVIDLKSGAGIVVGTSSFFVYLTQYLPVAGMIMGIIVSVMTALYVRKGLKIRDQEIEINNQKLKRSHDDD